MPTIRKAQTGDLDEIFALVRRTVRHMNALGNPQWGEDYPTRAHYEEDIARGELFTAQGEDGALLGVACINIDQSAEYAAVPWTVPNPAMAVHRMAVDPDVQRQGVGRAFFARAQEEALRAGVSALRIDTYGGNDRMQALILSCGFTCVGEIRLHGRPLMYPCFEKVLAPR